MAKKKTVATKVTSDKKSEQGSGSVFEQTLYQPHTYASSIAESENLAKEKEEERVEAVLACLRKDSPNRPSAREIYDNLDLAFTLERIDSTNAKAILERLYSRLVSRCEEDDATASEIEFRGLLLERMLQAVLTPFSIECDNYSLQDQVAELKKRKAQNALPINGLLYTAYEDIIRWLEYESLPEREKDEPKLEKEKVTVERNRERTTFFLDTIFEHIGVEASQKDQYEVISFLTGYSVTKIKKNLNNPGAKCLDSPAAHKRDMESIVARFHQIGLPVLANKAKKRFG